MPDARPTRSTAARRTLWIALAVLVLAPAALAQSLAPLLPAETFVALGLRDVAAHRAAVQPFVDELERLGLAEALSDLGGDDLSDATDDLDDALPGAFEGLEPLDLIGREAWVAVSLSQFNPLPVVTLAARVTPAAQEAFASAFAETAARDDVQSFSEAGVPFLTIPLDAGPDSALPVRAVAAARSGDLVVLSSDPDVLRGVLRRLTGSSEASFASSESYGRTVASLGDGNAVGYLDFGALADALAPYAQPLGLPELVARLQQALRTAGASAGVLRIVDDGVEGAAVVAPDPGGNDPALYALLTATGAWTPAHLELIPSDGLSISAGFGDFEGWWNYLNDLVAGVRELGIPSLDDLLADLGIDLRSSFFDWYDGRYAAVTTGLGDAPRATAVPDNLLGEVVYGFASRDATAARNGLALLLNNVSVTLAAFADPTGGSGSAEIDVRTVGGVDVTSYRLFDGVSLHTAVLDGLALVGTSAGSIDRVLAARAEGLALPAPVSRVVAGLPDDARSVVVSDNRATTAATAAPPTSTSRRPKRRATGSRRSSTSWPSGSAGR